MDIIASGPHNRKPVVRLSPRLRLSGMQPPLPQAVVASFRGLGQEPRRDVPFPTGPVLFLLAASVFALWMADRS